MNNIQIRKMTYDDIPSIFKADNDESEDNIQYLKNNLNNQENNKCSAIVALYNNQIAGYVFLYYECKWGGLKNQGLPSVVDLIVFEPFRRNGIASAIMDYAEKKCILLDINNIEDETGNIPILFLSCSCSLKIKKNKQPD